MKKRNVFKKVALLGATAAMVMGMATTAMAGSDGDDDYFVPYSTTRAVYDAYCGYSSGSAGTYIYMDSYATWATLDVSMKMYAIDAYFYEYIDDDEFLDENEVYVGSASDSTSDVYNSMAVIEVDVSGASWTSGERTFHGYRVESDHTATTNLNNSNPADGKLEARY